MGSPGVWNPMSQQYDRPTITLAEFLLARIGEDEADARTALQGFTTGHWTDDGGIYAGHPTDRVVDWVYNEAWSHIARHDPERVLAECEAKRKIVELHANGRPGDGTDLLGAWTCITCGDQSGHGDESDWPCETLLALAMPYVEHPDFRDEWRP